MIDIFDILNSEKARICFIKGLINLSKAQEMSQGQTNISDEELGMLRNSMAALKIPEDVQINLEQSIYSKENIVDIEFDSKRQALFFLREGLQICYVEGNYYDAEKAMIKAISHRLGVSDDSLKQLEAWALEGIEWSRRGDKLLELEG